MRFPKLGEPIILTVFSLERIVFRPTEMSQTRLERITYGFVND